MTSFQRQLNLVAAFCIAPLFRAQAEGPDPAYPVPGAPLEYRSAFGDYQPLVDGKPGDWRSLNDAVRSEDPTGSSGRAGAGRPAPGRSLGDAMPTPPSDPPRARSRVPAAGASMPAMKDMPGMSGHAGHRMQGMKP